MEYIFLISLSIFALIALNKSHTKETKKKREQEKKKLEEKLEEERKKMEANLEEERKQEKLKKEIDDLADAIIKDWNASLYADKVETPGNKTVTYRFENGDTIFYQGNTLRYETSTYKSTYTIGLLYRSKFTGIFNRIVEIINNGNTAKRKSRSYSKTYSHSYTSTSNTKTNSNPSNPRERRYETIMETIRLRKENLAKMSKNHPERPALENDLRNAVRKAEEIKSKIN